MLATAAQPWTGAVSAGTSLRSTKDVQFQGEIEVDESLFGRRVKYHRGMGVRV